MKPGGEGTYEHGRQWSHLKNKTELAVLELTVCVDRTGLELT